MENLSHSGVLPSGLDCAVCLALYCWPRLLNCGHTFCEKCIATLMGNEPQVVVKCPTCRRETHLDPTKGVKGLMINYSLKSVVDQYKCSEETCGEPLAAHPSSPCPHCQLRFCPNCQQKHHKTLVDDIRKNVHLLQGSQLTRAKPQEIVVTIVQGRVQQARDEIEAKSNEALANFTKALGLNKNSLISQVNLMGQEMLTKMKDVDLHAISPWIQQSSRLLSQAELPALDVVARLHLEMQRNKPAIEAAENAMAAHAMTVDFEVTSVETYASELGKKSHVFGSNDCTFDRNGNCRQLQRYAECLTCFGQQSCYGVCIPCAKVHHVSHDLLYHDEASFTCDCGLSKHCLPLCTGSLTGDKRVRQQMYLCYDCFNIEEYRRSHSGATPGMCVACWKKCHAGHNTSYYGLATDFFCDCGLPACKIDCKAK